MEDMLYFDNLVIPTSEIVGFYLDEEDYTTTNSNYHSMNLSPMYITSKRSVLVILTESYGALVIRRDADKLFSELSELFGEE